LNVDLNSGGVATGLSGLI